MYKHFAVILILFFASLNYSIAQQNSEHKPDTISEMIFVMAPIMA